MTKTVELAGEDKVLCPNCKKEIDLEDALWGVTDIAEVGCDDCQTLFKVKANVEIVTAFEVLPWEHEERE
jgi:predicted  nucleic acid-binding Zn ribbon protein